MHRFDTSALTRSLNLLGEALPLHLLAPGEFNQKGYIESGMLSPLNEAMLLELGSAWFSVCRIDWNAVDPQQRADFRMHLPSAVAVVGGARRQRHRCQLCHDGSPSA